MKRILLLLALLTGYLANLQSQSTSITWTGTVGAWEDGANWNTEVAPVATDVVDLAGGTVTITDPATATRVVMGSSAVLTIDGSLTISGFVGTDDGLDLSVGSTVVNNGTLTITNIMDDGTDDVADGIFSRGPFMNNGTISISGVGNHGIHVGAGTFTNAAAGIIVVNDVGATDGDGDGISTDDSESGTLFGTFDNQGLITINLVDGGGDGLYVNDQSTFNNTGTINISNINASSRDGIRVDNDGILNNNSGGTINVAASRDDDIFLERGGVINNSGTINSTGAQDHAIFVEDDSKFNNLVGGVVTVVNANDHAVRINPDGTPGAEFSNAGTLSVTGGSNGNSELIQIQNGGLLTNSGMIDLIDPSDHGIEIRDNATSTLNNLSGGIVKVTNAADDGIRLTLGVINNDGELLVDGSTSDDIETDGNPFNNTANAVFRPGSSPGDLVLQDATNLGTATVVFEIGGTTSVADYDVIFHGNAADALDISAATAQIDFINGFVPVDGDCFLIVDAGSSAPTVGMFASVTDNLAGGTLEVNKINGDADVQICFVAAVLPVELTSFEGRSEEVGSILNWETASELNNDYFEVQYSMDGRDFTMLNKVAGNGTTSTSQNYSYVHKNPTSTNNYYRLKQVDFDGAFEYSDIVYLQSKRGDDPIAIYPNPAYDVVTYQGVAATLTFYDVYGRKVMEKNTEERTTFDVSNLEIGVYLIEISTGTNEKMIKQFIKNK